MFGDDRDGLRRRHVLRQGPPVRQANQHKRLHAVDEGLQIRREAVVGQAVAVFIINGQVSMLQRNRLEEGEGGWATRTTRQQINVIFEAKNLVVFYPTSTETPKLKK